MTFTEFSCKKTSKKNSSNQAFWLQILNYETCVLSVKLKTKVKQKYSLTTKIVNYYCLI